MENLQIKSYAYLEDKYGLLSMLGLFIPVPISNIKSIFKSSKYGWEFTIKIGYMPLGWIIIIIAWLF